MTTVNLGTSAHATAVTSFAPSLAMPPASYSRPTMKPVMFCRNTSGMPALRGELDEVRPLQGRLREEDAVVGQDRDRISHQPGEAADERLAVERLELLHLRAVHDPPDHLAHVVGPARVGRDDAVQLGGVVGGLGRLGADPRLGRGVAQVADDLAGDRKRVVVVGRHVVGDAPTCARGRRRRRARRPSRPRRWPPSRAAGRRGRSCRCRARSRPRRSSPARRRRRRCTTPSRPRSGGCRRPTCGPGCRRCGRSGRGRGRPRPGAAGRRRRSRPGRGTAGGSGPPPPGRAGASSRSSGSSSRP